MHVQPRKMKIIINLNTFYLVLVTVKACEDKLT